MDAGKKEFIKQMTYAFFGCLLFALGANLVVMPLGLYNGGFMGTAQLIRTFLVSGVGITVPPTVDLAGIVYFIINVPLFYMGYKVMGRKFTITTFITVAMQSALLVIVPVPTEPIISDYLTACVIGGIIAGTGTGLILRGRTSSGGQDIVGVVMSKKYPNTSVGRVNILMNVMVYAICLFLFNIEVVVYSLIYTSVLAMAIDKVHIQNINTSVMIFTKKQGVAEAIMSQTGRGVTDWDGEGAYTKEESKILLVMINKYEVPQIKHIVKEIDPNAFMIFTEGCSVEGNFEKRL